MNNRKSTAGRPIVHIKKHHILGFTVKVLEGSLAYKSHQDFRKFVEVNEPSRSGLPKPSNKRKAAMRRRWEEEIYAAYDRAVEIKDRQTFKCTILPKIQRTSIRINLKG